MKKINFQSFKTRLIVSFSAMFLLLVAVLAITLMQLGGMISKGNEVLIVQQPSRLWVVSLENAVQKTNVATQSYLLTGNEIYQEKRKALWKKDVQIALDSIDALKEKWDNPEDLIQLQQVNRLTTRIRNAQENAIDQASFDNGGSASISPYNYPNIMGDTILVDVDFESWLNSQVTASIPQGNPNAELYASSLEPLTLSLESNVKTLKESLTKQTLSTGEEINDSIARFNFIELGLVLLSIIIAILLYRFMVMKIMNSVDILKSQVITLGEGNLPEKRYHTKDELNIVLKEINVLTDNLKNVREFALEVGKGSFDNDISVFNNQGDIGSSLAEMRDSLKQVSDEAVIRNWTNKGFAEFGDILRQYSNDLDALCDHVTTYMVKYLEANQGSLFIVNQTPDDKTILELVATYAYDRKKFVEKTLEPGQGLVGQSYLERESIYLKEIPKNYITITSGLGKSTPSTIFIVPLKLNDEIFGVLEIGSFHELKEHERDFVERISENIASSISTVKTNENTKRLLEESQQMTEEMRAQEEEMRQNMEELQATQEEMERSTREQTEKAERMRSLLNLSTNAIISSTADGTIETFNHAAERIFGYSADDIIGSNVRVLMPQSDSVQHDTYMQNYIQTGEKKVIGKGRRVTAKKSNGDEFPAFLALNEGFANGKRFFVGMITDITDTVNKEQAQLKKEEELLKEVESLREQLNNTVQDESVQEIKELQTKLSKELNQKLQANEEKLKKSIEEERKRLGL